MICAVCSWLEFLMIAQWVTHHCCCQEHVHKACWIPWWPCSPYDTNSHAPPGCSQPRCCRNSRTQLYWSVDASHPRVSRLNGKQHKIDLKRFWRIFGKLLDFYIFWRKSGYFLAKEKKKKGSHLLADTKPIIIFMSMNGWY